MLALLMTAMGLVLMPVQAAFSRAMERRADRFAVELTRNGDAYARAMEGLAAQSLADPDPPRPVVVMLYSHPPIVERIRAARDAGRQFRMNQSDIGFTATVNIGETNLRTLSCRRRISSAANNCATEPECFVPQHDTVTRSRKRG